MVFSGTKLQSENALGVKNSMSPLRSPFSRVTSVITFEVKILVFISNKLRHRIMERFNFLDIYSGKLISRFNLTSCDKAHQTQAN